MGFGIAAVIAAVAQAFCLWGRRASCPVNLLAGTKTPGETPVGPTAGTAMLRLRSKFGQVG